MWLLLTRITGIWDVWKLLNKNEVLVNFMLPCKRNGYFQWPLRQDKQIVEKQFILKQNVVTDCVGFGRQWFVCEYEEIQTIFSKFHTTFFS